MRCNAGTAAQSLKLKRASGFRDQAQLLRLQSSEIDIGSPVHVTARHFQRAGSECPRGPAWSGLELAAPSSSPDSAYISRAPIHGAVLRWNKQTELHHSSSWTAPVRIYLYLFATFLFGGRSGVDPCDNPLSPEVGGFFSRPSSTRFTCPERARLTTGQTTL